MKIGIDTTFLLEVEIIEQPGHRQAYEYKNHVLDSNDTFMLTPQTVNEFIRIVTDPKRFERPLPMRDALARSRSWWNGLEIEQVFPTDHSIS
jgi:predicted nucleic acid-binding protein